MRSIEFFLRLIKSTGEMFYIVYRYSLEFIQDRHSLIIYMLFPSIAKAKLKLNKKHHKPPFQPFLSI